MSVLQANVQLAQKERIVLDLDSEVNQGPGFYSH